MPPKSSSASSGTRKKHLRKALGEVEPPPPREKKEKGKKAHRSDPPRPKVYIAPVKPAAAVPDPLESSGLAHRLPPALLVVLRSLGKKAPVTKVRALEELQRDWVAPCARAGAEEEDGEGGKSTVYAVLDMLPVWLHHLPAHLVHPSRRIRLLTATLHQTLLRNALLREQLVNGAELPAASGTWALAAQDPDRAVAAAAGAARVTPDVEILVPFLERTLMDPDGLYAELNPPPLAVPPPPPRGSAAGRGRGSSANARGSVRPTGVVEPLAPIPRAKGDEQEESEGDRRARLRIAAFGALKHLLESNPTPLPPFLASPALWSALHHAEKPSFLAEEVPSPSSIPNTASTSTSNANAAANEDDDEQAEDKDGRDEQEDDPYATYAANPAYRDTEGFGHGQPALRRAAWALVPVVVARGASPGITPSSSTSSTASASRGDIAVDTTSTPEGAAIADTAAKAASNDTTAKPTPSPPKTTLPPALLLTLARAVLRSAWVEPDSGVQGAMWAGVLGVVKAHPPAWSLAPQSYHEFLHSWLARAAGGTPAAYGGAVVVVSSVGSEILAPIDTLFDAFWAALGGPPALSSAASTSTITSEDPSDSTPPAAPGQVNAAQDGSDSAPPEPAAADNAETPEVESAEVDASATVEGELEKTRLPARPTPAPSLTTALPAARARAGAAFLGALLECAVFVVRRGRRAGVGARFYFGEGGEDGEETLGEAGEEEREQDPGTRLFVREVGRVWGALEAGSGTSSQPGRDEKATAGRRDGKSATQAKNAPLLHVEARAAARLVRRALGDAGGVGGDLLTAALSALGACVRQGWAAPGDAGLVCAVLEALVGDAKPSSSEAGVPDVPAADEGVIAGDAPVTATDADARIRASGRALLADVLRAAVAAEDASFLVHVLKTFGGRLFEMFGEGESVVEALDALLARRAYSFLLTQPALLFAYLTHRAAHKQSLYRALLSDIAVHPEAAGDALGALVGSGARKALEGLTAVDGGDVYASTSSVDATTRDASVAGPLDALITGDPMVVIPTPVLAQILERAELFLSPTAARKALSRVVQGFAARVEAALVRPTDEMDPELSRSASTLAGFETDLALLGGVLAARPEAVRGPDAEVLFPAVYVFAYVLPETKAGAGAVEVARNMWVQWCDEADATGEERVSVLGEVKRRLGVLVCSTDVCVTPEDVLNALAQGTLSVPVDVVTDVFPSKVELDAMLEALPSDPPAASLAVLHPLLPPAGAIRPMKPANAHDARGYAAYARIVAALLQALAADRRAAKEHVWALRHVLALALYAEDLLAVPAAPSPVFDAASSSLNLVALAKLGTDAQQFATYLLTSSIDDGWRARTLTAVMGETALVGGGALPGLLVDLIGCARKEGSRDCRLLERVLLQLLQDADKAEADLWVALARKIEKTAPETCIAVVSAVSTSRLEPPRLERYRNELAADLLGIPAGKANKQGLLALRKLAASAPPADSDVVFLPQQRSVNVFKACQQWIASDEDIEEELESVMTLVFFSLAPLLQNVPGTHWDLTFDVLENNLDTAALTDDETLVTLARTLRLITLIQDLALTNKTLRADWEGRQMEILTMVRDLAAGQLDGSAASTPRSTCRELVLSIVQDLPASLITEDTLPKMCHLLADPSVDVQKMTYQLLNVAARKRTEHFVIEAGVDVDAVVKADLPLELLDILQTSLNFNQGDLLDLDESTIFGYLLGWMVVFDLFTDASLKVRLSYVAQLRTLDIIGTSFIPNLLSLLGVDQGIPKAFKLDMWNVEEYFVQLYESGSTWSIQVLAAHLYYRALLTVPSLIYNWVLDCKDRQLSSSIATYTSLHFSPVIIRAELAHVKSPEATAELVDENLTVKVATAVNEVVASYLVDEHQLEIKLKIPSDWPLHKIEVKDVQRVGVEETRWRAWILAVQQTLWSQNGRIVDGIGLFKKNVTLHFEGQVECAICYSIISVMDGTLPRKPCKTCKNRFHSGCLYKWFSTSHSSSCPLCRSDII